RTGSRFPPRSWSRPRTRLGLSRRNPFVAHFYPWEAKTKERKKSRRRRSPNPNQSPVASAKGSLQPSPSKRRIGCRALGRASSTQKGPPLFGGPFCVLRPFSCCFDSQTGATLAPIRHRFFTHPRSLEKIYSFKRFNCAIDSYRSLFRHFPARDLRSRTAVPAAEHATARSAASSSSRPRPRH